MLIFGKFCVVIKCMIPRNIFHYSRWKIYTKQWLLQSLKKDQVGGKNWQFLSKQAQNHIWLKVNYKSRKAIAWISKLVMWSVGSAISGRRFLNKIALFQQNSSLFKINGNRFWIWIKIPFDVSTQDKDNRLLLNSLWNVHRKPLAPTPQLPSYGWFLYDGNFGI